MPAMQVSLVVQRLPSSQAVPSPTGAWVQAPALSQPSAVQGLPSSQAAGEQGSTVGRPAIVGGGADDTAGSWISCSASTAKATQAIWILVATTRPEPFRRPVTGASRVMAVS